MVKVACVAVAIITLLLGLPGTTSAQATGAIVGVVRDTSAAVLPGVTVEVASPALIERVRNAVTDEQGQYRIIDLRPGVYSVTFTLTGFSTFKREGIELTANFTATVNGDLKVGAIEETVTVSGQAPLVDTQNVNQRKTISQELLDAVPTNRSPLGFASLTPAVITPPDSQDVGGSKGELSVRMAVHGTKQTDQKLLVDGMRNNHMAGDGTSRSYFTNIAATQEVVVSLGAGGGLAEQSVGGVLVNAIPKDGGNRLTAYFYTSYTGHGLQSDNLTKAASDRGLTSVNKVQKIYDLNGAVGGPLMLNKLWFFSAHRKWGDSTRLAGLYHDANLDDWIFTKDLSRPADAFDHYQSDTMRLTWQAAKKHKIAIFYDMQVNNDVQRTLVASPGTAAWEAATSLDRSPISFSMVTWTFPATNRILFEAGAAAMQNIYESPSQKGISADTISVIEQGNSFRFRAPTTNGRNQNNSQINERLSMSYVTGSHQFKTGLFLMEGISSNPSYRGGTKALSYTLKSGSPIQLTEYASPIFPKERLSPELGLFAQDQWKIKRTTVNLGLRFEYFHSYVPASTQPGGLFIDARSFDKVDCVPCWTGLSPRLGAAYDLFGDGKTAIKVSLGRYTASTTTGIAGSNNPVNSSVNQVNRSWSDDNHNFVVDCDLRNPEANNGGDQCGRMSNVNFGKSNIITRYDSALLNGFNKNLYNWQTSAVIEHQFTPGIAVSAGYFRTWYGNFTVTDNLAVTSKDYTEYCITAPSDSRLPVSVSGKRICGLYDLNPTNSDGLQLFGVVNNLVKLAKNYGKLTEVYNGADFNFSARLPRGAQVAGGLNVGNSVSNSQGGQTIGGTNSATNRCFIVDSPQQMYQCAVNPPLQKQFKVNGSYPLGWNMEVSANFQTIPGPPITATYNATTTEVQQTLARPLSGSVSTVPIELIRANSVFSGRINQLDWRLTKTLRLGKSRVQGMFDIYNLLNASPVLSMNTTWGQDWLKPNELLAGRLIKFGGQLEF